MVAASFPAGSTRAGVRGPCGLTTSTPAIRNVGRPATASGCRVAPGWKGFRWTERAYRGRMTCRRTTRTIPDPRAGRATHPAAGRTGRSSLREATSPSQAQGLSASALPGCPPAIPRASRPYSPPPRQRPPAAIPESARRAGGGWRRRDLPWRRPGCRHGLVADEGERVVKDLISGHWPSPFSRTPRLRQAALAYPPDPSFSRSNPRPTGRPPGEPRPSWSRAAPRACQPPR